jgi:hypothetical protein
MIGKPFKPPLLQRRPTQPQQSSVASDGSSEPLAKKRRLSSDSDYGATTVAAARFAALHKANKANKPGKTFLPHRKPLGVVSNASIVGKDKSEDIGAVEGYYTVLWSVFHPCLKWHRLTF